MSRQTDTQQQLQPNSIQNCSVRTDSFTSLPLKRSRPLSPLNNVIINNNNNSNHSASASKKLKFASALAFKPMNTLFDTPSTSIRVMVTPTRACPSVTSSHPSTKQRVQQAAECALIPCDLCSSMIEFHDYELHKLLHQSQTHKNNNNEHNSTVNNEDDCIANAASSTTRKHINYTNLTIASSSHNPYLQSDLICTWPHCSARLPNSILLQRHLHFHLQQQQQLEMQRRKQRLENAKLNGKTVSVIQRTKFFTPPSTDPHQVCGLSYFIHQQFCKLCHAYTTYLCDEFDFFYRSEQDRGFGCGIKNIQTVSSSLLRHDALRQALFAGRGTVPPFIEIQRLIDEAHGAGFDEEGREEIGTVANTRKWVGTPEAYAVFSYYGIKCTIQGFQIQQGQKHEQLMKVVYDYYRQRTVPIVEYKAEERFQRPVRKNVTTMTKLTSFFKVNNHSTPSKSSEPVATAAAAAASTESLPSSQHASSSSSLRSTFVPPIYFQHSGHSRTIIGCALDHTDNTIKLLVVDPDCSGGGMRLLADMENGIKVRQIMRSIDYLQHLEYEVLTIDSAQLMTQQEREASKIINSGNARPPVNKLDNNNNN